MGRIGIATWNVEGRELSPKLRMFAEMGYTAASVNNSLMDTLSADDEAEATDIIQEHDLLLTVHGGLIKPGEPVDEHLVMSRAERTLRWHERTGRFVATSYDVPSVPIREGVKRKDPGAILDITAKLLDLFAGSGMRVLLEDCPLDAEAASKFGDWTEKYPHLGILIDLGHMNIRLREHNADNPLTPGAVESYLKAVPWEIAELHIHSNNGAKDQHAPPYWPTADMPTAARVLREIGFAGISTIELVPAWCGLPPEEIAPACRKSLEYWRGLIEGTEG